MRAAHHRDGSQLMRHAGQFFDDFGQFRQQNSLTRFLQHQSVGQVVDVFAGAGKVDEFAGSSHFRHAGEAFFKPILDGFDVVIGGRLNGFDGGGIFK